MSDHSAGLVKQAENLGRQSAGDHVACLVKAALNSVPVFGGSLASLIDDYIPESRQKRVEEFSKALATELVRLGRAMNEEYVKTDEFAYLFTRVYQNVSRDYQKEKLDAYRNILINSLRVTSDPAMQERFLLVLERLLPLELAILKRLYNEQAPLTKSSQNPQMEMIDMYGSLGTLLGEYSEEELVPAFLSLTYQGLVDTAAPLDSPLASAGRITRFGYAFIEFVLTVGE